MNIGGPTIHAVLLTAGLDGDKFSTLLVTGRVGENEGDMSYLTAENAIEPVGISELQREPSIAKDAAAFYKLYRFLKNERPDIVHTHMAKAGAIGRLAARIAGVPVVVHTFHGHTFHSYFNPLKTGIFIFIERLLARITDKIIVISELQKREVKQYLRPGGNNKITLIPLGFKLDMFLENRRDGGVGRLRERFNISKNAIIVGIIGRLAAIKNHTMFLSAAKEIKRKNKGKDIKFLIVGDGGEKDGLKAFSDRLGIGGDVIFTGWLKDMPALYSAVDIVALTSLNEGTPVSLIEALAGAKPVVAADAGGVRDVVEDGKSGFIVPSGDISAFSEAVSALINDEGKRKAFGLHGREFVRKMYSARRLIGDIERLYITEFRKHYAKRGNK